MSEFNERFSALSRDQQAERYSRLAEAALGHYALEDARAVFVQHNGGITYRIEADGGQALLLKIAEPVGDGTGMQPEHLRSGLAWLAALADETALVVQQPVPARDGELLAAVPFDDLKEPFHCSLHRWVEGEHAGRDLTSLQAYRIGSMMARMHDHGSRWARRQAVPAETLDAHSLSDRLRFLKEVIDLGLISTREWRTVAAADRCIRDAMDRASTHIGASGPIHGDLHQGNLLFHGADVSPIDFGGLTLAPLVYDLGVTLYHTMYLEPVVRRALLDGYRSARDMGDLASLESLVCAAALENLAYQVTIPEQRHSPLFAHNVREFVEIYCRKLAVGELFVLPASV